MRAGPTGLNDRVLFATFDKFGGGGKPPSVSPNYSFINKLREKDGLPPLSPKKAHETIKNILIFDDDVSVTELFSDYLTLRICQLTGTEPKIIRPDEVPSPSAVNIVVANLPDEIIKAFDRHQSLSTDLVITDFTMYPHIKGDEVANKFRTAGFSGFIIGATGRPENRPVFYAADVDLVLLKPIEMRTFDGIII